MGLGAASGDRWGSVGLGGSNMRGLRGLDDVVRWMSVFEGACYGWDALCPIAEGLKGVCGCERLLGSEVAAKHPLLDLGPQRRNHLRNSPA